MIFPTHVRDTGSPSRRNRPSGSSAPVTGGCVTRGFGLLICKSGRQQEDNLTFLNRAANNGAMIPPLTLRVGPTYGSR